MNFDVKILGKARRPKVTMEEYIVKSIRLFLRFELKSKSALGFPESEVHQFLGPGLPQC